VKRLEWIDAKTILSGYSKSNPWFGCHYNMNLYKGCSHGCIYCDSRSECYHIDNFDTVKAKKDAINILERELRGKRRTGVIGLGAMSDPYNPFEKDLKLTRKALEKIAKYGFGVAIATKSNLILRDMDILLEIKKRAPVLIKITITTADDELSKKIEPRVNCSSSRFEVINEMSEIGIFSGILMMPVIPFLEDNENNILKIIKKANESGAKFIYPSFGMTLRQNQRVYFLKEIEKIFPGMCQKYIDQFGTNYNCKSPKATELFDIFKKECEIHGILYRMKDIVERYQSDYGEKQLSFL
jgi:DNA repair photolyase